MPLNDQLPVLTQERADARYALLIDVSTTPGASKIPRANGAGKIDVAWIPQGAGSGLDADLLDGLQGAAYALDADLAAYLTISAAAAAYQPLDGDLSAIAALATTGFAKRTGVNTWTAANLVSGDIPDLSATYLTVSAAASGYQPLDTDLTTIAGLSPSDGAFLRRTGGAWTGATLLAADIPTLTLSKISDAGTLASQNADTVNITGGAIDGVTFGFNNQVQGFFGQITVTDTGTTNFPQALVLQHDTVSTPAPLFGIMMLLKGQTSGIGAATGQLMAGVVGRWLVSDHATRQGTLILRSYNVATVVNSVTCAPTFVQIDTGSSLIAGAGSAASPALQFSSGGANAGIFANTTNQLSFSTNSTVRLVISTVITPQVPIRFTNGSVTIPSVSFASETNSGLYFIGAADVGFTLNGALLTEWTANAFSVAGDLKIATVGRGLYMKEGTNATMGVATLVGGTVVVNTTKVTANSRIFLMCQTPGGTPGFLRISARTAGTSFTILSSNGADTSVVAWVIVEPA